jgi:hypothetical protein
VDDVVAATDARAGDEQRAPQAGLSSAGIVDRVRR